MLNFFRRKILAYRFFAFIVMGLAFFIFGALSVNIFFLLSLNVQLIFNHGWQAVMEGGLQQLMELLLMGYASLLAYLVFKSCEYSLVHSICKSLDDHSKITIEKN